MEEDDGGIQARQRLEERNRQFQAIAPGFFREYNWALRPAVIETLRGITEAWRMRRVPDDAIWQQRLPSITLGSDVFKVHLARTLEIGQQSISVKLHLERYAKKPGKPVITEQYVVTVFFYADAYVPSRYSSLNRF